MSLNDPQWGNRGNDGDGGGGRRPNQGPPDLEQLWRDLNRRLSGIFDRKRGGGNRGGDGGGDRPPVQFSPRFLGGGIGLLLALVVIVWLASGFYIVDAGQRGLVLQFGRYKESTEPGLSWRLPYPIQSHELVNISGVRTLEVGYRGTERNKVLKESLMLTDDENIINIQFAVQYILKDPVDYVFANRNPDEAVMQVAETAIRQIVGKNKMDFVLYEGREQVAVNASQLMQEILDRYKTGILISKVTMQNAQPPEQVQAAFDDAVKASQDRARQKNEGQAYANDVIPRAQGTAARLNEEALGYKQRVIATAEGDASRFSQINAEYAKAPEVTRSRMYLDTMQQVYSNTSKVMVDTKGQGNLLYLPLDKLIQAAGAVAASPGGAAASEAPTISRSSPAISNDVPPQVVDRNEARSRDTLRLRDRESR
ncbi:MAG: FtsH protease activity modulator HflK [Candidatus Accumulibacter sp.]|uniref:FtsH protease activity modulator HflK n=1 Tax=Accumulibacter sp. TaxID=2053492 RepID=UPI0019F5B1CE|nr:FtsH protease activity modulator HflK [Accumulibacter sp.]MBE2259222.1 FtsH protease activity modulator HflK [Paracoccaceae bacterium]MCB1942224.1 FtsH protease activity modulator HflK [Accumulibacter sp.]MCP5249825.1 FtsH protease activity modulator HflK [Accumulibacter sp.]